MKRICRSEAVLNGQKSTILGETRDSLHFARYLVGQFNAMVKVAEKHEQKRWRKFVNTSEITFDVFG